MGHALDVIVSLSAVFAAFSLLTSWVQEQIASVLNLRGKTLASGIARLVDDAATHQKLFNQPSITSSKAGGQRLPSYLSSRQFVMALVGVLNTAGTVATSGSSALQSLVQGIGQLPNCGLKTTLTTIAAQAAGDYDDFLKRVEQWYNDQMDRVSGWYRRSSQLVAMIVGALLAIAFNVDTVRMSSAFMQNPVVLVNDQLTGAQAQQYVSQAVFQQVKFGWPDASHCPPASPAPPSVSATPATQAPPCTEPSKTVSILLKVLGLAITAVALTLGAPFWFDLLGNIVNVRNSGPPPKTTNSSPSASSNGSSS
jgi:hypothetical protein